MVLILNIVALLFIGQRFYIMKIRLYFLKHEARRKYEAGNLVLIIVGLSSL